MSMGALYISTLGEGFKWPKPHLNANLLLHSCQKQSSGASRVEGSVDRGLSLARSHQNVFRGLIFFGKAHSVFPANANEVPD